VVKINVYVVDYKPEYRPLLNAARSRYVSQENPPASTLIGVQSLARKEFLVEIEAVAVAA
jgi:enamine deaminase RidA (YjgF/YER057c/UK114 family)